jgi:hypothetical protein
VPYTIQSCSKSLNVVVKLATLQCHLWELHNKTWARGPAILTADLPICIVPQIVHNYSLNLSPTPNNHLSYRQRRLVTLRVKHYTEAKWKHYSKSVIRPSADYLLIFPEYLIHWVKRHLPAVSFSQMNTYRIVIITPFSSVSSRPSVGHDTHFTSRPWSNRIMSRSSHFQAIATNASQYYVTPNVCDLI